MVKEARAKELRLELLNSKRLKAFFEEHPGEQFGSQPIVCLVCTETDAMNFPYPYLALLPHPYRSVPTSQMCLPAVIAIVAVLHL